MVDINNDSSQHKRRVRYKGTHPRSFDEKYKEHNFEKYTADVEKVIQSGKTPVGTHRPICVKEILDILKPSPGQTGLDATLGFGGHAVELLKAIIPDGQLFALDVDPIEIVRTEKRLRAQGYSEKNLIIKHSNFAGTVKFLDETESGFDFILADLGFSSMQLDNPTRGFTYKREGPLDLRLNPERGQSAAKLIRSLDVRQLEQLFIKNADEPRAKEIALTIFDNKNRINKTTDLANVIANAMSRKSFQNCTTKETNSIRRVFQALRIEVNDEFSAIKQFMRNLHYCLKPQGRVAILCFHSGEDKLVMQFLDNGLSDGTYSDISCEPIRPSSDEHYSNPRSKSALLRWAVRQ